MSAKKVYVVAGTHKGAFLFEAVYRSKNRGENWEKLDKGLPKQAYLNILRHAMDTDNCDSAGIYFGANTGLLFHSSDSGDSWQMLADFLPPIFSVTCAVI